MSRSLEKVVNTSISEEYRATFVRLMFVRAKTCMVVERRSTSEKCRTYLHVYLSEGTQICVSS